MCQNIDKVIVLMSSYNGEHYIEQQIDSILNQDTVSVDLIIRDDGSRDSTISIIKNLQATYSNIILLEGENVGYIKSFTSLVQYAFDKYSSNVYFAFVDQDDVWMKNKLSTACCQISQYDQSKPCLFCSNSIIIDSKGNKKFLFKDYVPSFQKGTILHYGTVQGCSMVFNYEAVSFYVAHKPHNTIHDKWMVWICAYFGYVIYSSDPLFYYRIHNNNAVGASANHSILNRCIGKFRRILKSKSVLWQREASEFISSFGNELSAEDKQIIKTYLDYKTGVNLKIKMLTSSYFGPRSNTFVRICEYYLDLFLNRL